MAGPHNQELQQQPQLQQQQQERPAGTQPPWQSGQGGRGAAKVGPGAAQGAPGAAVPSAGQAQPQQPAAGQVPPRPPLHELLLYAADTPAASASGLTHELAASFMMLMHSRPHDEQQVKERILRRLLLAGRYSAAEVAMSMALQVGAGPPAAAVAAGPLVQPLPAGAPDVGQQAAEHTLPRANFMQVQLPSGAAGRAALPGIEPAQQAPSAAAVAAAAASSHNTLPPAEHTLAAAADQAGAAPELGAAPEQGVGPACSETSGQHERSPAPHGPALPAAAAAAAADAAPSPTASARTASPPTAAAATLRRSSCIAGRAASHAVMGAPPAAAVSPQAGRGVSASMANADSIYPRAGESPAQWLERIRPQLEAATLEPVYVGSTYVWHTWEVPSGF